MDDKNLCTSSIVIDTITIFFIDKRYWLKSLDTEVCTNQSQFNKEYPNFLSQPTRLCVYKTLDTSVIYNILRIILLAIYEILNCLQRRSLAANNKPLLASLIK